MSDYTAKRIKDMEAAYGGGFVKVRAELGVTSFGVQVIQLPPDYTDYPLHDHAESGQEEVFTALSGSGWIEIEGERVDLEPDVLVRVGPSSKRKVFAGPDGLRMLALGAVPGAAYEINPSTELSGSAA
jgi:mannose-6-phosphate isomerase-like protein (cupin superfamily)